MPFSPTPMARLPLVLLFFAGLLIGPASCQSEFSCGVTASAIAVVLCPSLRCSLPESADDKPRPKRLYVDIAVVLILTQLPTSCISRRFILHTHIITPSANVSPHCRSSLHHSCSACCNASCCMSLYTLHQYLSRALCWYRSARHVHCSQLPTVTVMHCI